MYIRCFIAFIFRKYTKNILFKQRIRYFNAVFGGLGLYIPEAGVVRVAEVEPLLGGSIIK
jgi:hypothetical protein